MNRKLHSEGIIKDDKGVALTEFVIVIPIVLLLFFAVLQYFDVVRASQLGNYAAYVAARSYAVHAAVDGDVAAQAMAKKAACLALAPIARTVPGELGTPLQFDPAALGLSFLQSIFGKYVGTYGDGYIAAQSIRLLGTNNFKLTPPGKNDDPKVVKVEINYPQPIYLPGLKEMWNLVGGVGVWGAAPSQDIVTELDPLAAGTDVWAHKLNTFGKINTFPYINVQSKCAMGYEDWNGTPRNNNKSLDNPLDLSASVTLGKAALKLAQYDIGIPLVLLSVKFPQ